MRFIIHELPYERPVAAGKLLYEQDGRPTGAVESWRLTDAVDGYRFLRVDLDAQQAASGQSTLYHLALNPAGKPEQLKYRFWKQGVTVSGVVLWEGNGLFARRQANGVSYEDVVEHREAMPFWFPATSGLALLVQTLPAARETTAILLRPDLTGPENRSALFSTHVSVSRRSEETLMVMGKAISAEVFAICWEDQARTVWLDKEGRPLRMQRSDGFAAVATQLVEHLHHG
jgi:hypothetical protein